MDLFPENEGLLNVEKVIHPHNDDDSTQEAGNQLPPSQSQEDEQLGSGYDLQNIAQRRATNPDCVHLPDIDFEGNPLPGGTQATGWEQVDPSVLVQIASEEFDPMKHDSDTSRPSTPLGTPTPRPRQIFGPLSVKVPICLTTPTSAQAIDTPNAPPNGDDNDNDSDSNDNDNEDNDNDDDNGNDDDNSARTPNSWDAGWNTDDKAEATIPTAGRRSNAKREIIQHCFKDIRDQFCKTAAKIGCSASALKAEFHDSLTTSIKPSSWRKYEVYFKYNKEREQK
ncbi:hypothetical protein C0991_012296 [Blastosporella zonata]|nr:hypothetical protein C0991_012296 [Blastosporella zonata]